MKRRGLRNATSAMSWGACFLMAASCTNVDLELLPVEPSTRDDKALVEGSLCTTPPEGRVFPLRVLFVVDSSDSMRVTDPPDPVSGETGRERAVRNAWQDLLGDTPDGARFGILRFSSDAQALTPVDQNNDGLSDSFYTDDQVQLASATSQLGQTARTTNYISALSEAQFIMRTELEQADLDSLPLTKYVVIFVSDGLPDPDSGQTRETSNDAIVDGVLGLKELAESFRVRTFEFHTAFISAGLGGSVEQDAENLLDRMARAGDGKFRSFPSGESLNFLFVDFTQLRRIFTLKSIAVVNQQSIVDQDQIEALTDAIAPLTFVDIDGNEAPNCGELWVDTDGDGLADALEEVIQTDIFIPDTDDDGLQDRIEWRLEGLDPLVGTDAQCFIPDPCIDADNDGACDCIIDLDFDGVCDCVTNPELICLDDAGHDCLDGDADGACDCPDLNGDGRCDYGDRDADGLNNCEEVFFGTAQNGTDTDADGLPDFLEVRAEVNPGVADDMLDLDLDGMLNGPEVLAGTDPSCDDAPIRSQVAYRYQTETRELANGQTCYDFQVSNITLVPSPENPDATFPGNGWNRILVYAGEVAFDDPDSFPSYRVACIMMGYSADGDLRNPPSGRIRLTEEDFIPAGEFDASRHCIWP